MIQDGLGLTLTVRTPSKWNKNRVVALTVLSNAVPVTMNAPQLGDGPLDYLTVGFALSQPVQLCDHIGLEVHMHLSTPCPALPSMVALDSRG